MNYAISSLLLACLSSFIFVTMDALGYVDHKMKWKDLNWWQCLCFIGIIQFFVFMLSLFIILLLSNL